MSEYIIAIGLGGVMLLLALLTRFGDLPRFDEYAEKLLNKWRNRKGRGGLPPEFEKELEKLQEETARDIQELRRQPPEKVLQYLRDRARKPWPPPEGEPGPEDSEK